MAIIIAAIMGSEHFDIAEFPGVPAGRTMHLDICPPGSDDHGIVEPPIIFSGVRALVNSLLDYFGIDPAS